MQRENWRMSDSRTTCRVYPAKRCGHLTKKGRTYCPTCTPHKGKQEYTCVMCAAVMRLYPSEGKKKQTCSSPCKSRYQAARQAGQKSHLWLGGRTSQNRKLRNSADVAIWRRAVFERDGYRCMQCGYRGNKLTADHISPWSTHPELRFEVSNGRTLCWPCHSKLDTSGWKLFNRLRAEREGANLMDHQREFLNEVLSNHGVAFVARNIDDAEEALK